MTVFLTICAIGLLATIAFARRPLKEWWLKRLVRQTVAMSRICELAGIDENDLKWLIRSEQSFVTKSGRKHRKLELEFGFNSEQSANTAGYRRIMGPSGTNIHEPYRVIAGQNGTHIEESVASAIRQAKAHALDMSGGNGDVQPLMQPASAQRYRAAR